MSEFSQTYNETINTALEKLSGKDLEEALKTIRILAETDIRLSDDEKASIMERCASCL